MSICWLPRRKPRRVRLGKKRAAKKPVQAVQYVQTVESEGSENLRDPEAVAQEIVKLQAAARSRDGDIVETCCSKCFSPQVFSSSQIKNLRVDHLKTITRGCANLIGFDRSVVHSNPNGFRVVLTEIGCEIVREMGR